MRTLARTAVLLGVLLSVGLTLVGQQDIRPRPWSVVPAECFHALWTHGSNVQLENPEAATSVVRYGYYTRVTGRANSTGWFHFAIPTPVIGTCYSRSVGGEIQFRYRLWRVLIVLRTSGASARVTSVHVWDGNVRRATYDEYRVTGSLGIDTVWNVPGWPEVFFGVGISIKVEFSAGGWVDFIGAGGDFLLSDACGCRQ